MSSFLYNAGKKLIADGLLHPTTDTLKCILLMNTTSCDTENDGIEFIDDFATLGECDDTSYVRVTLEDVTVTKDDSTDSVVVDASDITFGGMGGDGSNDYCAVLVYKHVTNDANSVPIAYFELSSEANKLSVDVLVQWSSDGLLEMS